MLCNFQTMVQMLRVLLVKQMSMSKIPEKDMKKMMQETNENVSKEIENNQTEEKKETDVRNTLVTKLTSNEGLIPF